MTIYRFIDGNPRWAEEVRRIVPQLRFELSPLPTSYAMSSPEPGPRARDKVLAHDLDEPCFAEATDLTTLDGRSLRIELDSENPSRFCRYWRETAARMHLCVALRRGQDAPVEIFSATCEGQIASAPAGAEDLGWDRIFVPDGFDRTLAELSARPFLLGLRSRVYVDLASAIGGVGGGAFEVHITVGADADPDRFGAVCDALGVKRVVIALPAGAAPLQPMTASYHRGTLAEVQAEAFAMARTLGHDFDVRRVRIEAVGDAALAPRTDEEARDRPAHEHFEYHVKVILPPAAPLAALDALGARHGARRSANTRQRYPDGKTAHFLTLRLRDLGSARADAHFRALVDELAAAGHELVQRTKEYTVYDSDAGLDRGWLAP